MARLALYTYRDAVRWVLDYLGGEAAEMPLRDAKRAVQDAYREITQAARWQYYYQLGRLNTVADYDTGTIAYDDTGGANERMVTLTSGTWPSWAAYGVLVIDEVSYQVATRESNSVITLSVNSNPGADVAAGTSYSLYRDTYPLPTDFLTSDRWVASGESVSTPHYVHPTHFVNHQRTNKTPSTPRVFTITNDPNYSGVMAVRFWPPPDAVISYDYGYYRRPRPLNVYEVKAGTVTASASSATLTGTGTTFLEDHENCVIRLSPNSADEPGGIEWGVPYAQERTVITRTSDTALTVDTAWSRTLSGVKYNISDPLDLEEGAMLNAFRACCLKNAVMLRKEPRVVEMAEMHYRTALIQAREADSRSVAPSSVGGGSSRGRLSDYPMGADEE